MAGRPGCHVGTVGAVLTDEIVYFTRRYCRPVLNHERAPDLALQTAAAESRLGRPKTQIRIIGPLIHGDAKMREIVRSNRTRATALAAVP